MTSNGVRRALEQLEEQVSCEADALPALAFLAAQEVPIDLDELHAARRRAVLLLATGGDPRRELSVDARAVAALAADLDRPERRKTLAKALVRLLPQAEGLTTVTAALQRLLADGDFAWRWLACALLAEELVDEEA